MKKWWRNILQKSDNLLRTQSLYKTIIISPNFVRFIVVKVNKHKAVEGRRLLQMPQQPINPIHLLKVMISLFIAAIKQFWSDVVRFKAAAEAERWTPLTILSWSLLRPNASWFRIWMSLTAIKIPYVPKVKSSETSPEPFNSWEIKKLPWYRGWRNTTEWGTGWRP